MDKSVDFPLACQTPACWNASSYIQETMSPRFRVLNRCQDFPEWACGGFRQAHEGKVPSHRQKLDTMDVMQDGVDAVLRDFLDRPYAEVSESLAGAELKIDGSEQVDAENLAKVAGYYRTCMGSDRKDSAAAFVELMNEVKRPFAAMDEVKPSQGDGNVTTYEPAVDTGRRMAREDWDMLHSAHVNLVQLGIFPFVKIEVQQSLVDPNKMAIVLTPEYRGAMYDAWVFRYKKFREPYKALMAEFLKSAHAENLSLVQNLERLPGALVKLERDMVKKQPAYRLRAMKLIKSHVSELSLDKLERLAPELGLKNTVLTIARQHNVTVEGVEVIRPEIIRRVNRLVRRQTRETVRSFLMWQAFLQTVELWDLDWTPRWTNFTAIRIGVAPNKTHEEKCMSRAQKHFGHILDSFFIRKEYSPETTSAVKNMAESILWEWRNMAITTGWITDKGKSFNIKKLDRLNISIGHPLTPDPLKPASIAEFYAGAGVRSGGPGHDRVNKSSLRHPGRWTHFHDYFHLQLWHGNKSWSRLGRPAPGVDEWPVPAHSLDVQYLPQRNQLIIPAGLLRLPIYHRELPAYYQYGGLGTRIGTGIAKAIDGVGQQYQVGGSIRGKTWRHRDWVKYTKKLRCFDPRWRRLYRVKHHFTGEQEYTYKLEMNNIYEAVLGDHEGMEAAYRAWVKVKPSSNNLPMPVLEVFTNLELYWMARATRFCTVRPPSKNIFFEAEVARSDTPPNHVRLMDPVLDFGPFHSSMNCRCGRCLAKKCRIFGRFLTTWDYGVDD